MRLSSVVETSPETPRKCARKSMERGGGKQPDTAAEPSGSRGQGTERAASPAPRPCAGQRDKWRRIGHGRPAPRNMRRPSRWRCWRSDRRCSSLRASASSAAARRGLPHRLRSELGEDRPQGANARRERVVGRSQRYRVALTDRLGCYLWYDIRARNFRPLAIYRQHSNACIVRCVKLHIEFSARNDLPVSVASAQRCQ